MWSIDELINKLKKNKKFRMKHSVGVMNTAEELAKIYDEDVESIRVAALLHDYAKIYSNEELRAFVKEFNLDLDPLIINTKDLCHGPVAAELIKKDFNIKSEKILNAIRYHTFTDRKMTKFDIILYIADVIEPNRRPFKGYYKIKKYAYKDINKAMLIALNHSIRYIIKKNEKIYCESIILRNKLLDELAKEI